MQLERGGGGCAHLYSRYAISVRCASVICTWWNISCEGCQCCSRRGSVSAASAFSAGGCRQVIVHDYMLQRTEGIIGFVDDKRTNITQGFQPPRTQDSIGGLHTQRQRRDTTHRTSQEQSSEAGLIDISTLAWVCFCSRDTHYPLPVSRWYLAAPEATRRS